MHAFLIQSGWFTHCTQGFFFRPTGTPPTFWRPRIQQDFCTGTDPVSGQVSPTHSPRASISTFAKKNTNSSLFGSTRPEAMKCHSQLKRSVKQGQESTLVKNLLLSQHPLLNRVLKELESWNGTGAAWNRRILPGSLRCCWLVRPLHQDSRHNPHQLLPISSLFAHKYYICSPISIMSPSLPPSISPSNSHCSSGSRWVWKPPPYQKTLQGVYTQNCLPWSVCFVLS